MNPKPFHTGYLKEQDGHSVHYAEFGTPKGIPVVVVHGGPGSKSKPKHVVSYDLGKYHVITFDQRGCGQSLPSGMTEANTTEKLVGDMERLRATLHLKKWFVAGGSWGSTLALAYAEAYPENVLGLLLSSVFLVRQEDVDWPFAKAGGVSRLFPDVWERRSEFLGKFHADAKNAASVLLKEMNKGVPGIVREITAGVQNWEDNLISSQGDVSYVDPEDVGEEDIATAKIFLHYDMNSYFLKRNELMENAGKIAHIPTVIVHGRYDVLCPIDQAWELAKKIKDVDVVILPNSNHHFTADGDLAKKLAFRNFLILHAETTVA